MPRLSPGSMMQESEAGERRELKLQNDNAVSQLKIDKVPITELSASISGIAFRGEMRGSTEESRVKGQTNRPKDKNRITVRKRPRISRKEKKWKKGKDEEEEGEGENGSRQVTAKQLGETPMLTPQVMKVISPSHN